MYNIIYHKLVLQKDFKKIPEVAQKKILRTVHKKLKANPKEFGKPLSGGLKGYYRLRINPYRVIYRIENQKITVFVVKIGLRKDLEAYVAAAKRLGLVA